MFRYIIIFALLLVVSASPAVAVDTLQVSSPDPMLEKWRWTEFDRNSGLAGPVRNIFEDRNGNIWFATDRGAQRYDGMNWTTYTIEDGLAHNRVSTVIQTRDGAMWFGTRGGSISRFDPGSGQGGGNWTTYTMDDGLVSNDVGLKSLLQARDGTLWAGFRPLEGSAGAQSGIGRFDGTSLTLVDVPVGPPRPNIRDIHEAADGSIWFATDDGALRFDGAVWTRYTTEDGLVSNRAFACMQSHDGSLWFACGWNGISRFDGRRWRTYTDQDGLPRGGYFSFWQTADGTLWCGSYGAIFRFDGDRWKAYSSEEVPQFRQYQVGGQPTRSGAIWFWGLWEREKIFRFDPASTKWKTFAFEERLLGGFPTSDGAVWFVTPGGAVRYDGTHWLRYTEAHGLLNAPIYGMNRTDDGSLWFFTGTNRPGEFRGLSRYRSGMWERYTAEDVGLDYVRGQGDRILRAADGSIWVAGGRNGVSAVSRYDGRNWRTYTREDGMTGENVFNIYQTGNGDLWFGARDGGVLRYDGARWTSYTTEDGLAHNAIYSICQTPDGKVWVGTLEGLSWFDGAEWHSYTVEDGLPSQKPGFRNSFVVSGDDLWFHYQQGFGAGVTRYNGKTWKTYTVRDGLVDNRVASIYRATDGTLWFGTMGGISRFDGTSWASYTVDDGLPGDHISRIWQSSDGTLWIITWNGKAGTFTPDIHGPETTLVLTPEVVSSLGNILLEWSGKDRWNDTPTDNMRYQWRLDNGPWSPASKRTARSFVSLASGRHTFEVRAMDQDMNNDPTPAVHAFVVEPPWWRNPWMVGLVAVLLVGIGFQTVRVVRRDRRLREANIALSAGNKELFEVNKDLQQKTEDLERERAVERIRAEVQAMEQASDFEKVLSLLVEDLKTVGLHFDTCGIDVLDEPVDRPTMAYFEAHGFLYTTYTIDPEGAVVRESYHTSAPFPPVIRETVERFIAGEPWQGRSGETGIVEVPASSYGRLRITAPDRERFPEEEIGTLQDFAGAIALGYTRYLDFQSLEKANREIQEQTERKSRFLSSMSHELRTPMTAIKGFADNLLDGIGGKLNERQ